MENNNVYVQCNDFPKFEILDKSLILNQLLKNNIGQSLENNIGQSLENNNGQSLENNNGQSLENNNGQSHTYKITYEKSEQSLFNKLLDSAYITIKEFNTLLLHAYNFFEDYEISIASQSKINKFIYSIQIDMDVWNRLTSKPDYNMILFQKRILPYFNLNDKTWKKASIDALEDAYVARPHESSQIVETEDFITTDQMSSPKQPPSHIFNNNFLEWQVLPISKYSIDEYIDCIEIYYKLHLQRQSLILFLRLLLSPKYCHIIKSINIWRIFKSHLKNKCINEIVKYCCYYAMYILRHEETILFSNVTINHRIVFTLDEACSLPTFSKSHINRNPYIQQLTDSSRLSDCMPFYLIGDRKINSMKQFRRRFELATGGAFKNVDFQELNMAVTGSILVPCVHTNPLEDKFKGIRWEFKRKVINLKYPYMTDNPKNKEEVAFLHYLEYYYPSYCSLTDKDFIKQVINQKSELLKESAITYNEQLRQPRSHPQSQLPQSQSIQPQLADIDISCTSKTFDLFKKNTLSLYKCIKRNCAHRGDVYIKEVKTLSSIKFKIYGPGIPRPMDIFRIPYRPCKMVKKFHVHAVKMYFNNNLYILRSCVAALLSGVNESYRWFSCNKIPIDVLLKYAQRGLTIILNDIERSTTSKYLTEANKWGLLLSQYNINPEKIYCCVNMGHPFFSSEEYGIRQSLRKYNIKKNNFHNSIVISQPNSVFSFGELKIKDNNKHFQPCPEMIDAVLNSII